MLTTEYYRTDDMGLEILPDSQWLGKGVEAFGLNDVGRDANLDFENMLLGYHPKTHEKLVQKAGEDGRIMGIDLTFSAEKYVTLLLVEASPEERKIILDIQRKATDYCLEQVASEIKSRTGAQGKTSIDGDIVVRSVVHLDSRNGDPQLHTHNVLLNVMQCTDGKTRTLDMEPVFEMQKALGAVHRSLIAKGIHDRLGLSVYSERMMDADGNDTGEIYHHVEGIEKTDEREFSMRRRRHGLSRPLR